MFDIEAGPLHRFSEHVRREQADSLIVDVKAMTFRDHRSQKWAVPLPIGFDLHVRYFVIMI
jgi:hypothetical protein